MESEMTFTYCVRKDTIRDEERKDHTVYGIEAVDSKGEILSSFSDLFFDRQKAESFVRLCNESGLSLIHLSGAVEDALAEE